MTAGPNDLIVIPAGVTHRLGDSAGLVSIFAPAEAKSKWTSACEVEHAAELAAT